MSDQNQITVTSKKFNYVYSVDGSLPNPLEATFAALSGCAGVYTLKACKKLNKSAEGISIECKPIVKPDNPSFPTSWITEIHFPQGWEEHEKTTVNEAVKKCAVKELIQMGSQIQFVVNSSTKVLITDKDPLNL